MLEHFKNTLTETETELLNEVIDITGYDDNEIYDKERLKLRYLMKSYLEVEKEETIYSYYLTFSNFSTIEKLRNKDLCNFTVSEFKSAFMLQRYPSTSMINKDLSILTNYIDFAIESGYVTTNINPLKMNFRSSEVNELITPDNLSGYFVTEEEIRNLTSILKDPQDKLYYLLPFFIPAEAKDVRDLKRSDFDFQYNAVRIVYSNSGVKRIKELPEDIMYLIKETFHTHTYLGSYDGAMHTDILREPDNPDEYLFIKSASKGKPKPNNKATITTFNNRVRNLKSSFPAFKMIRHQNVFKSGMYWEYAKFLVEEGNYQDVDDIFSSIEGSTFYNFMISWGYRHDQRYNFLNNFKTNFIKLYKAGKFDSLGLKLNLEE